MEKVKKHAGLLVILMAAVSALQAQNNVSSLRGHVSDSTGRLHLQSAGITLKSIADSTYIIHTLSDSRGLFTLADLRKDVYVLTVQFVGYKTFTSGKIAVGEPGKDTTQLEIALTPQSGSLQTVTVTAPGNKPFIEQKIDKITMNIAASPIAASGTAYDALLHAPGVTEENDLLKFRKRGITVLINGRQSNLSGDDLKNMLTGMPASQIEKIEILPNPSAKYDAEGGSVINIILAKNMNYGINGTVISGIGTGRFAKYNEGLSLNYRKKALNLYGSYDYQHNEQYFNNRSNILLSGNSNILQSEYDVRKRYNQSYKAGADYDIDKNNTIGILYRGFNNQRDRNVSNRSDVAYEGAINDSFSTVSTKGYARFVNSYVNVYYKAKLDSNGRSLTLNADYFKYHKTWNDDFTTNYFNENGHSYKDPYLLRDNSPAENTVQSFSADYVHPSRIGDFEAGIKTTFTTTDNNALWQFQDSVFDWKNDIGMTNRFIYKENVNAGYLDYSKKIGKLDLQGGIRAEQTTTQGQSVTLDHTDKRNYINFFPNVSLQFTRSENQQFGLSYRKSISRPSFDLLNPFLIYQSEYSYIQGNPDLQPEIDHTIDFSHSYKNEFLSDLSYTRSINCIASVYLRNSSTNAVISTYGNYRYADIYSATESYVKQVIKNFWTTQTTLGAFYAKFRAADPNSNLPVPKVTGYISSSNTFSLPAGITMELSGYYYTSVSSASLYTKPQYSASFGAAKKILNNKGSLKLSVTDLFNTQISRYQATYQDVNMTVRNKMESRFVNLVFSYRFGNKNVKVARDRESSIEDVKGRMRSN